jgi:hypothetical protein
MKKVFEIVKSRGGYDVELDHFLNFSLNFVRTDLGDRFEVIFNGVGDGVFFKFDWVNTPNYSDNR